MRPNGRPFKGGRGIGRGGFKHQDLGPPQEYVEIGSVELRCIKDVVCRLSHNDIPYFNAPVYNENHTEIGKIDDVFGRIDAPKFSVVPLENLRPDSFIVGQKVYIDGRKLLSAQRVATSELPGAKRGAKANSRGRGRQSEFGRESRGRISGRGGHSFGARGRGFRGENRGGGGRGFSNNRFQRPSGNRSFRRGRPSV